METQMCLYSTPFTLIEAREIVGLSEADWSFLHTSKCINASWTAPEDPCQRFSAVNSWDIIELSALGFSPFASVSLQKRKDLARKILEIIESALDGIEYNDGRLTAQRMLTSSRPALADCFSRSPYADQDPNHLARLLTEHILLALNRSAKIATRPIVV
jgi:hypothetical protein